MKRIRPHLTYANIIATLALFIALGGSSYAAVKITGKSVRNGSLTGKDIKKRSIGSRPIKQSALKSINAKKVGGRSASSLTQRCPGGTVAVSSTCVERSPRAATNWTNAAGICSDVGRPGSVGRRLPSLPELRGAVSVQGVSLTPGGELTSQVSAPSGSRNNAIVLTSNIGSVRVAPDAFEGRTAFRCAVDPANFPPFKNTKEVKVP